ncbi:MAG: hypothetical protein U0414_15200 [Polyangiaceae bacterium]
MSPNARSAHVAARVSGALVSVALLSGVLFVSGLLGACTPKPVDLGVEGQLLTADAQDTTDTVELATTVAALPSLTLEPGQVTLASVVAAQQGAKKFFQPSSCLTVEAEGNVVTYTFDHCSGPWGAADLTGQEVVAFSPGDGPGATLLEMHSEGLKANGRDVEHHAEVYVALEEGGRRVLWRGGFSGVTGLGKTFANDSDLDLFVGDDGCSRLSGTAASTLGLRGLTLDFQNIERCGPAGTCPDGVITATGKLSGVTVTLVFDGTPTLTAIGENGGELDVKLKCTPPAEKAP